jgi:hypothetical protein
MSYYDDTTFENSKGHEALFAIVSSVIENCLRNSFEYPYTLDEIDAVFALVPSAFSLVPLELHCRDSPDLHKDGDAKNWQPRPVRRASENRVSLRQWALLGEMPISVKRVEIRWRGQSTSTAQVRIGGEFLTEEMRGRGRDATALASHYRGVIVMPVTLQWSEIQRAKSNVGLAHYS